MMQIYVNGEAKQVDERITIAELVSLLDLVNQRIAIEVNQELVLRSTFDSHRLTSGDRVEIVHAIGGG